ncbi:uncharacterized protein VP01_47g1 [Puccinia sorghi]|uniref:Uncharacterized protein n=1 Tax=Puccinia sorghi TaxID=27349 RepID=A0A0L6UMK0_9BASI|nr:uncharacterized protein VP01_47g1 [Puccinia sorghi]
MDLEETLQHTQARLDTIAGQQNPAPAQPNLAPAPASNLMVLAKPQPFDGTRGTAAKVFIGQIGLHAVTYPKDYTATSSQPYLDKFFNKEPVVFDDFLNDFKSSFFDQNCRHCAQVAWQNLL